MQLTYNQVFRLIDSIDPATFSQVDYELSETEVINAPELLMVETILKYQYEFCIDTDSLRNLYSDVDPGQSFDTVIQALINKNIIEINHGVIKFIAVRPASQMLPPLTTAHDVSVPNFLLSQKIARTLNEIGRLHNENINSYYGLISLLSELNPQHAQALEIDFSQSAEDKKIDAKKQSSKRVRRSEQPLNQGRLETGRISAAHHRVTQNYSREVISRLLNDVIVHISVLQQTHFLDIKLQAIANNLYSIAEAYKKDSRVSEYYPRLMDILKSIDATAAADIREKVSMEVKSAQSRYNKRHRHDVQANRRQSEREESNQLSAQLHRSREKFAKAALAKILSHFAQSIESIVNSAVTNIHESLEITDTNQPDSAELFTVNPQSFFSDDYALLTASQNAFFSRNTNTASVDITALSEPELLSQNLEQEFLPLPTTAFYDSFFNYSNSLADPGVNNEQPHDQLGTAPLPF